MLIRLQQPMSSLENYLGKGNLIRTVVNLILPHYTRVIARRRKDCCLPQHRPGQSSRADSLIIAPPHTSLVLVCLPSDPHTKLVAHFCPFRLISHKHHMRSYWDIHYTLYVHSHYKHHMKNYWDVHYTLYVHIHYKHHMRSYWDIHYTLYVHIHYKQSKFLTSYSNRRACSIPVLG